MVPRLWPGGAHRHHYYTLDIVRNSTHHICCHNCSINIIATGWCPGGVRVEPRWCPGGAQAVPRRCPSGAQVAPRWCTCGAQVVPRCAHCHHFTLLLLSVIQLVKSFCVSTICTALLLSVRWCLGGDRVVHRWCPGGAQVCQ